MASPTIIGLAGKKRSGKDTLAQYIAANYGFQLISFAAALRKEVTEVFELDVFYDDAIKDEPIEGLVYKTPRDILRYWGQRRRSENTNYWVNKLDEYVNSHPGRFIVTDVRMSNELEWVKSQGGIAIRVCRPAINHVMDAHVTECALDGEDLDFTVTNVENSTDMFHSFEIYAAHIGLTKVSPPITCKSYA